jgi:hypothetical protein
MLTSQRLTRCVHLVRLTVSAGLGLVLFDAAALAGFARLHERLRRRVVATRPTRQTNVDDVVWAVEEACVWYVKRVACLQRSAIAVWMLRNEGVTAELVIGCRPLPFESHAWVEVHGVVVNDRPQYQRVFTVLDRL